MSAIERIRNYVKAAKEYGQLFGDPTHDIRCAGCCHIDGPICEYPIDVTKIESFDCSCFDYYPDETD